MINKKLLSKTRRLHKLKCITRMDHLYPCRRKSAFAKFYFIISDLFPMKVPSMSYTYTYKFGTPAPSWDIKSSFLVVYNKMLWDCPHVV